MSCSIEDKQFAEMLEAYIDSGDAAKAVERGAIDASGGKGSPEFKSQKETARINKLPQANRIITVKGKVIYDPVYVESAVDIGNGKKRVTFYSGIQHKKTTAVYTKSAKGYLADGMDGVLGETSLEAASKILGAVSDGDELNEVIIDDAERVSIKSQISDYTGDIEYGSEFGYDTETGVITVINSNEDNAVTADMEDVYTLHEIRHAQTYEWLKKHENGNAVKYLLEGLQSAVNSIDPGFDEAKHLLMDRLKYANSGLHTDLSKVAEVVAILSSEPNIRKAFIDAVPQKNKGLIGRLLDAVKKVLGNSVVDMSYMIPMIDAVVEEGSKDVVSFGSSKKSKKKRRKVDDYTLQDGDFVNNPDNVKKLMGELIEVDEVSISDSHKNQLESIVDIFVSTGRKFIPDMKVYLDKKADENGGALVVHGNDSTPRGIYVGVGGKVQNALSQKSAAEVYVHELIHGATAFALAYNKEAAAHTRSRLEKLYEHVMGKVTAEDLMPVGSDYDMDREREVAQAVFDHMSGADGLEEFITHGLTNERFVSKLKDITMEREVVKAKNAWEALKQMFTMLLEAAFNVKRGESSSSRSYDLLVKLSLDLAKTNNKAIRTDADLSVFGKMGEAIDKVNEYIAGKQDEYEKYMGSKPIEMLKGDETRFGKFVWMARNIWRFTNDPKMRPFYENVMSEIGVKPEGFFQSILRGFSNDDSLATIVEKLGMESGNIDGKREEMVTTVGNLVFAMFDKKPDRVTQEILTGAVLDTDLQAIYGEYSTEELRGMLTDDKKLTAAINASRKELLDSKAARNDLKYFYINEAAGLGKYMATHEANETQLFNARNIVKGFGTGKKAVAKKEVIDMVDRLASLEALRYTGQFEKGKLSELLSEDEIGVRNLVAMHKDFVEKSDKELFGNGKSVNAIKGYTKELFNDDIDMHIAPTDKANKKELLAKGYKFLYALDKGAGDSLNVELGVYISGDKVVQSFNRAAIRLTDTNRKGITLSEARRKAGKSDLLNARLARKDIASVNSWHKKNTIPGMMKGIVDPVPSGRAPVFNEKGVVINYRYMMSKKNKRELLGQDVRAPRVMGRMFGSILDKKTSGAMNKKVMDVMFEDANEYFDKGRKYGKNHKEYVIVKADSSDDSIVELWNLLPSNIKDRISKLPENIVGKGESVKDVPFEGGIPVRRDLLFAYFGARDLSLADNKYMQITPAVIQHAVRFAEAVWKEIVQVAKADIVIRTPAVLLGNIVSNLVLSVQLGMKPTDVFSMQWKGFLELRSYKKLQHELTALELVIAKEVKLGMDVTSKQAKAVRLRASMERNSVSELVDAGLFQSIIEDVNVDDLKGSTKIGRAIDKKMENMPKIVKDASNYLYLTEKTSVFKAMTTATQYSDFIARYALYHANVDKSFRRVERREGRHVTTKEKKQIERNILKHVTDAFVNYNTPDSKILQYMNDMGMVMFTKFLLRIQKVIKNGIRQHPVNFLAAFLAQEAWIGDVDSLDDITNHNIFSTGITNSFKSPIDTMQHFLTPTMMELPELWDQMHIVKP